MASSNGKRRSRAAGRSASATKEAPGIDLTAVREKTTKLVGSRAGDMVKAATAEIVKTRNVTGMKYFFAMIGLFPFAGQEPEDAEEASMTRGFV